MWRSGATFEEACADALSDAEHDLMAVLADRVPKRSRWSRQRPENFTAGVICVCAAFPVGICLQVVGAFLGLGFLQSLGAISALALIGVGLTLTRPVALEPRTAPFSDEVYQRASGQLSRWTASFLGRYVATGGSQDLRCDVQSAATPSLPPTDARAANEELVEVPGVASRPAPSRTVSIRPLDPNSAEHFCAEWMNSNGALGARVTQATRDGGIDVESERWVAQVKHQVARVSPAAVRELHGVAAVRGKRSVFFALGGYSKNAVQFADEARVALFRYDRGGGVTPESDEARRVSVEGF